MGKEVLIVIDVQNAVMENTYQCEEKINNMNRAIHRAREKQIPVIYVQHEYPEGPMKRGAEGWQLHPDLEKPLEQDAVIFKTVPNAFVNTSLKRTLDNVGADHLFICGAQTDYCVDSTSRGAFDRGYHVTLVSDAHTTCSNEYLSASQIIDHTQYTLVNFWSETAAIDLKSSHELEWERVN
ncbi:isochorismatase family protein [Halobacillus litoralis]|uniref:Isochorismatase family protein n=1 Tax=Halobacillus litoralis TaxID=45668 RepID=A0A845FDC0_9BACI|nr:cysteine hydrolase family protein [Halobacillus litoralis]MYL71831.1 isochorismatase family protein [Halobacillus litoralis]